MKVFSAIVCRWMPNETSPILLSSTFELSSFGYFQRSSVQEVALFVTREVISRSAKGERQSVQHKEYFCHAQVTSNEIACAVITDGEYPGRVAFGLISQILDEFVKTYGTDVSQWTQDKNLALPVAADLLTKYQDPSEADSMLKIQKDLEDTKGILVKSIDQLLERGAKLEDLADKSQDLSFQSKAFLKQSQKMNSCCTIL